MNTVLVHYWVEAWRDRFNPIHIVVDEIESLEPELCTAHINTKLVLRSGREFRVKETVEEIKKQLTFEVAFSGRAL